MLKAHEANRLANERIAAHMKGLLDEVEQAIREECAEGRKNLTWNACHVPEQTRYDLMEEVRRAGYHVSKTPAGRHLIFIRWC